MPLLVLGAACVGMSRMLTQNEAKQRSRRSQGRRSQEAGREERIEDFLTDRPDGDRSRRRPHPPGRPQARRRPARTHPARAPKRRRRDRHHHAQGPHPRQHAAGAERVPHQDRRHAGGRRPRRARRCCWRSTPASPPARSTASPPRTRRSAPTPSGSTPARKDEAEMLGYTVVEPGAVIATHLTEVVPPPRRRDPHPRRGEAPGRRAEEDAARGGRAS